jgi:hypothetical protein
MAVYPNDMLHPTYLMGAIQERPDRNAIRQGYIGSTLLPMREVPERRLMWDSLVSENNLAGFYSSKGHAIPGDDVMFKTHFANLVDVKAARYLDPDIVGKVRDPGMPAVIAAAGESWVVKGIQQRIQMHVRDNLAWCDDAVDAQIEYMQINAMLGEISWPPKDASGNPITSPMPHWNAEETMTITYPLYASFKQDATTLTGYGSRAGAHIAWNATNADPIKDLEVIAELMVEEKGLDPTGGTVVMSRSTLSQLAFNANVLRWITGVSVDSTDGMVTNSSPAPGFADISAVKSFIKTRLGYNIVTYDAQWTYREHNPGAMPTIRRVKFLPEGKVLIIPPGSQPGFLAVSPHETQDGSYRSGKIPWVYREPIPPYERQMGVSLVAFPVLTRPEEHFVLNAYA